jgi:hypothetical protein
MMLNQNVTTSCSYKANLCCKTCEPKGTRNEQRLDRIDVVPLPVYWHHASRVSQCLTHGVTRRMGFTRHLLTRACALEVLWLQESLNFIFINCFNVKEIENEEI